MLVITRKIGEAIRVGAAFVGVSQVMGNRVRLTVLAPQSHRVTRLDDGMPDNLPPDAQDQFVSPELAATLELMPGHAINRWRATCRDIAVSGDTPHAAMRLLAIAAANAYGTPKSMEAFSVCLKEPSPAKISE